MHEKKRKITPCEKTHEKRITKIKVMTSNIKNEFNEIKNKIDEGNAAQSKKLETIDKRLMDEFFKRKNRNHENTWKLILKVTGAILGAGSFIYLLIEKILGG